MTAARRHEFGRRPEKAGAAYGGCQSGEKLDAFAAATFLIAQGIPLRVIMEILGHSTITTTADIYGHVELELQRDATERAATALYGT